MGVAVLFTVAQAPSAQSLKLKLGNEGTYPPFSITNTDGSLSGLEPDLAREVCRRMGADCEITAMQFSQLLPALTAGEIDMIASQLTPLPERLEATEFTIPLILNPEGFVVSKNWVQGYDNAAFKGKRIGVIQGTSMAKYVEQNLPDAQPVYFEGGGEVQQALLAGKIDATFMSKIYWQLKLIGQPEGKDWKLSVRVFWAAGEPGGMSWAVQKGETALVAKVNEALKSIIDDCTYTEIRKKYLAMQLLPEETKCQ
jgi:ABC-type amino acid transport substrate-binding protein